MRQFIVALLLCLGIPAAVQAQIICGQRTPDHALVSYSGAVRVVPNAKVTVCQDKGCTQLVTVYSDSACSQPLATVPIDTVGNYSYFAPIGIYWERLTGAGVNPYTQQVSVPLADTSALRAGSLILPSAGTVSWSGDLFLARDTANVLALRNGNNPQALHIYGSYADPSNFSRLVFNTGASWATIGAENAGAGQPPVLQFATGGANRWSIGTSGHFIAATDNSYDIGQSGANRPRDFFLGRDLSVGGAAYILGRLTLGTPTSGTGGINLYQGLNGTAGYYAAVYADWNGLYLSTNGHGYTVVRDAIDSTHALRIQGPGPTYDSALWWFDGHNGGNTGMWMYASSNNGGAGSINMKLGESAGASKFRVVNSSNSEAFSVDSSGSATASKYCIGTSCVSAWPSGLSNIAQTSVENTWTARQNFQTGGVMVNAPNTAASPAGTKALHLWGGGNDGANFENAAIGGSIAFDGSNYTVDTDGGSNGGWMIRSIQDGGHFGVYIVPNAATGPPGSVQTIAPSDIENYRRFTVDSTGASVNGGLYVGGTITGTGNLTLSGQFIKSNVEGYLASVNDGTYNNGLYWNKSDSRLSLATHSIEAISILQNGNVGIGTTNPGSKLHVAGDARADGSLYVSGGGTFGGTVSANISGASSRLDPGTDLNTLNRWQINDVQNPANGVSGQTWHNLMTVPSTDGDYISQLDFAMTDNYPNLWLRTKQRGSWGGWVKFIHDDGSGNVAIPGTMNSTGYQVGGTPLNSSHLSDGASLKRTVCQIDIDGTGANGVIQSADTRSWECINTFGSTVTVTAVACIRDTGASTVQIATTAGNNLLSSACSPTNGSLATCSLNGSPAIPANVGLNTVLSSDGSTKMLHCSITGTR